MAYQKKTNYPSWAKPGVYPDGDSRQLGLDNDNLEKFSLGNWNSIVRANRPFLNKDIISIPQEEGPSILEDIPIYLTSPFSPYFDSGRFRAPNWRFFAQVYGYYNDNGDFSPTSQEGYNSVLWNDTDVFSYRHPYVMHYKDLSGITPTNDDLESTGALGFGTRLLPIRTIFSDSEVRTPGFSFADDTDLSEFMLTQQERLYNFLRNNPILSEENPISNDETYGSLTDENPIKLSYTEEIENELSQILNRDKVRQVRLANVSSDGGGDLVANLKLSIMFNRPKQTNIGGGFPNIEIDKNVFYYGDDLDYVFAQDSEVQTLVSADESTTTYTTTFVLVNPSFTTLHALNITDATTVAQSVEDGESEGEVDFDLPVFLIDDKDENGFYNAYVPNLINGDEFPIQVGGPGSNDYNQRIGELQESFNHPNYVFEEDSEIQAPEDTVISSIEGNEEVITFFNDVLKSKVDFEVKCRPSVDNDTQFEGQIYKDASFYGQADGNDFLIYDFNDDRYEETSYPIKVDLTIDLFNSPTFENILQDIDLDQYGNATGRDDWIKSRIQNAFGDSSNSYYRYQVAQWGDETKTLEDDSFLQTPFFAMYEMDEYPSIEDFNYKVNKAEQTNNSKPIIIRNDGFQVIYNKTSHVYNTPGIKNIKIIVYRYTNDGLILLSTTLISKNIMISDGTLKSQDFSIFGGTDFNFLPIGDNQAIIGGFSEDSDYHNSVSKITKDDNFISEDYLQRASAKDYMEKIKDNFLGQTPGQIDLSQTRIFSEPRDIYDFIGGNKLEWITNGFGSLPTNSSATDIFIRDDKCSTDINPANNEFLSIQNQAGNREQGILVGDYKVEQPENGTVRKEGVMKTPSLETNTDNQAF